MSVEVWGNHHTREWQSFLPNQRVRVHTRRAPRDIAYVVFALGSFSDTDDLPVSSLFSINVKKFGTRICQNYPSVSPTSGLHPSPSSSDLVPSVHLTSCKLFPKCLLNMPWPFAKRLATDGQPSSNAISASKRALGIVNGLKGAFYVVNEVCLPCFNFDDCHTLTTPGWIYRNKA